MDVRPWVSPLSSDSACQSLTSPPARSLHFKDRDPDTALLAAKILKPAEKYLVDGIRPIIVRQLEKDWPTTFEA